MNIIAFYKKWGILVLLILEVLLFAFISPNFLSTNNIFNVLRQVSMLSIVSCGLVFVLIGGGIDLSIGAQMAMGGLITAMLMVNFGFPIWLAISIEIIFGIAIGSCIGLIAVKFKIMPMVVTLGFMTSLQGIAQIITNGYPVYGFKKAFTVIGQGYLGVVPIPVIVMFVVAILANFVLEKTYFGRYVIALGSNSEAARLAGLNISKLTVSIYAICGFFSAVAGIILCARNNSAQPGAAATYAFDAITAIVLGGISIQGGKGKITGAIAGVVFIGVLNNALILMGINEYYKEVLKGGILIIAVALDGVEVKAKNPALTSSSIKH
jgi:ribose transport system permease protein